MLPTLSQYIKEKSYARRSSITNPVFARANAATETVNTPIQYDGPGKFYGRKYIFSKDLQNIWFSNGSVLAEKSESDNTWKVLLEEEIHFDTTMISPSGAHAFLFLVSGNKLIPMRLNDGKWKKLEAIKYPQMHFASYSHFDTILFWLDDDRALFFTTDEYIQPLYAATNDAGMTWHRGEIPSDLAECWREDDKLILNSYKVGIEEFTSQTK